MINRPLLLLLVCSLSSQVLLAQEQVTATALDPEVERLVEKSGKILSAAEPAASQPSVELDREILKNHVTWVLQQGEATYRWQYRSSILIFFVVLSIVFAGLALATWQLSSWLRRAADYDRVILGLLAAESGKAADAIAVLSSLSQNGEGKLKLTGKSVTVSSPYVGILVLVLSLAFFIAYLIVVYPISLGPPV